MVAALHPLFDNRDMDLGIDRRLVHQFRERRLVDVVRATAGHERAAGVEQLQRAKIDFLVARGGSGNRRLVLRERRRVENERVEPLAKGSEEHTSELQSPMYL